MVVSLLRRKDKRHESHRPDRHGMRGALTGDLRRDALGIFLQRLVAAVRDGGAALYRPVGGRASEMECSALALRISPHQRQGGRRRCNAGRLKPGFGYLLQSFKSLSAIENTASALISISRTRHCRESR